MPERLPGRFPPRAPVRRRPAGVRPFGVVFALLLVGLGVSLFVPARAGNPIGVTLHLAPTVRVTPIRDVVPVPLSATPVSPAPAASAVTVTARPIPRAPLQSAPALVRTPVPATPPVPPPTPAVASPAPSQVPPAPAPTASSPPAGIASPLPSPPAQLCLPILPLCV